MKSFHHRKEKLSYIRETKRFIPCDNWGLSTGIDIVTVDPRDIGKYREVKDH